MSERITDKHNSGIDVLRGIAILAVILLHVNIRVPFSGTFIGSMMPKMLYSIIFWSGYYGVCIFFVISGFLITTSALHKWDALPKLSLRGFYSMRFARIMPLLIALILVLSFLHLIGIEGYIINPEKASLGRTIFAALTFHINWLEIRTGYLPASWDVLWSLSIEEVFYLFFPIVCIICRKEWWFVALVPVFLIISPLSRTVLYPGNELGYHNHFAYLDAISLGCVAALVAKRIEIRKLYLTAIALFGWFLFLVMMIFKFWIYSIGLMNMGLDVTLLTIGTALILIWMQKRFVSGRQSPSRFTGLLRFLGRNSYEVYLTHVFIVLLFVKGYNAMKLSGEWEWLLYITVVIISGILGLMVARYFSNPLNILLRERFMRLKNHNWKKI